MVFSSIIFYVESDSATSFEFFSNIYLDYVNLSNDRQQLQMIIIHVKQSVVDVSILCGKTIVEKSTNSDSRFM